MISNDIKPYIIRGEMRVNPYSWIVRHNHSNAWWRETTRNMQITIKQKQRYDHVKNTAENPPTCGHISSQIRSTLFLSLIVFQFSRDFLSSLRILNSQFLSFPFVENSPW